MNKSVSSSPLIRAGWLRVFLYIIPCAALFIYKSTGGFPGFINAVSQPGLSNFLPFIFVLIITYIFRRWIDRKSFLSLGLTVNGFLKNAVAGGMLAIFIVCASSLILKATGHLKWTDIIFDPRALFLMLGSTVLAAFYEELIFRGYILSNLMLSFPQWLALLISALLFMIFHSAVPELFSLFNAFIMGLILGLNYLYTRNLWFPICFHIGWQFLEGPVLGFPDQNIKQSLLQMDLLKDGNIIGGASGLEGSFILTFMSFISLVALYSFLQKKINLQSRPVPGRI